MMDAQGCHLRIASVKMIDLSLKRGRLKFKALEFNLQCAFPQVSYSADDHNDNSIGVYSKLTEEQALLGT